MSALVQTGIGVAVSIILFVIGYRQTVGAKRERVQAANAALRRAVLRRAVLEDYQPNPRDLRRVIEGKAREFRVSPAELRSEEQLLTDVFSEVFENELIDRVKREQVETRISGALQALQSPSVRLDSLQFSGPAREQMTRLLLPLIAAASLAGATASLSPELLRGSVLTSENLQLALVVVTASVALMAFMLQIRRQREPLSNSEADAPSRAARFEASVAHQLARLGIRFQLGGSGHSARADFTFTHDGKRIAVEVRSWRGPVPSVMVTSAIQRLSRILREGAAERALIVIPDEARIPKAATFPPEIEVLKISDLPRWLGDSGNSGAASA